MFIKIKYILLLMMASILIVSCSKDQLDTESLICEEPVVYDDVRGVISASCGYTECHNGLGSLDNYNNFAGIETYLFSGAFSSRVFISRDMPPSYAVGATSLTEEELNLLKCWEQNGFSEF